MSDDRDIVAVTSGEGSDCCLWWTLAPYIFEGLKSKVGDYEAVRLVLEWAKTGKPFFEVEDNKEVNLSGLEDYNLASRGSCTFTLSRDPNGKSHQFAKEEAQRLVHDVFSDKIN